MESHGGEEIDYSETVDNFVNMFGHILTSEVIKTLVESYGGDMNQCLDAIMEITNDGNTMPSQDVENSTSQNENNNKPSQEIPPHENPEIPENPNLRENPYSHQNPPSQVNLPNISYAHTVQSQGAIPRQIPKTTSQTTPPMTYFWTDQIRNIIKHHNSGSRIMIIMRGLPGSGKTHLAKSLVESLIGSMITNYKRHIFSSDDYFIVRGRYQYDKCNLSNAHSWNQNKVKMAALQGISPIIVDNTNIGIWEPRPYVIDGVNNGYLIEVVEPMTPWAKKAKQLFNMNTHKVPLIKIKRMLDNYVENITGDRLIQAFGLIYAPNLIPPVLRLYPPIVTDNILTSNPEPSASTLKETKEETSVSLIDSPIKVNHLSNAVPPNTRSNSEPSASTLKEVKEKTSVSLIDSLIKVNHQSLAVPLNTRFSAPILTENENLLASNSEPSSSELSVSPVESRIQSFPFPMQSDQNSLQNDIHQNDFKDFIEKCSEVQIEEINSISETDDLTEEEQIKQKNILEAQKRLEEMQKFEEAWDNGEKWDENGEEAAVSGSIASSENATQFRMNNTDAIITPTIFNLESKPPRQLKGSEPMETTASTLEQSVNICQDWSQISMFMPPWDNQNDQQTIAHAHEIPIEKISTSTCMEMYDTNIPGKHKVIIATSRNINEFYEPPMREKIPNKRMLDKSTVTNDGIMITSYCPQKERHFIAFRKLFKHIERESLRYIFDNCCGDIHWAIENILNGEADYKRKFSEPRESFSDSEEEADLENNQPCTCLAQYGIIPNISQIDTSQLIPSKKVTDQPSEDSTPQFEKKKRFTTISKENMQLKKQIEQNVVISDNHYSEHCLKIRNMRHGENKHNYSLSQPSTSRALDTAFVLNSSNQPAMTVDSSDNEDELESNISESDKIVNVNLGKDFIKKLDVMFGRDDMEYPENIHFDVSLPTSLLNEINALWMESMMFQLDNNAKTALVKKDEEFARQLDLKQKELLLEGKEPDVPDFKEIMDLELALNIHMKDISEWRNNIPTDLATKMTQIKLFNLFPEIEHDTLLEMLFAHGNDFKATVEVLLISLGREDILESENGLNKFVMEKEIQRQEKLLEEQKKALSEIEWPQLSKGERVEMSDIQNFRDIGEQHLNRWNIYMQKAETFMRRGMTQVAQYYSEIASFHKTQYEQANSKAVATLIQYHAEQNTDGETVDLHYYRVKEAKEAMDLFIDSHIQRLRDTNKQSIKLFFITGRGNHSTGLPRVKPACIKRLKERGMRYTECNPGLLRARVTCEHKLTYQIP